MTEDAAINAEAYDLTPADHLRQPRARGTANLSARWRQGRSRIGRLEQMGCAKLLFPHGNSGPLQAVLLNTAGGVTGGDRIHLTAESEPGAALCLTTQAAERIYCAQPGQTGRVVNRLSVGAGARLDWLPQETILFDGADVMRRYDVDLAPDATFLAVEPLVFGRAAMGETLGDAALRDVWRVHRGGDLVFADTLRLGGDIQTFVKNPAVAAGAGAIASLLLIAPGAERHLAALNAIIANMGAASSPRSGVVFARLLATDSFDLRRALIPAITLLSGAEIPRTWTI